MDGGYNGNTGVSHMAAVRFAMSTGENYLSSTSFLVFHL